MNNWIRSLLYVMVAFLVVVPIFGLQLAYAEDVVQNQQQANDQFRQMSIQKEKSGTVTHLNRGRKGPTKLVAKDVVVEFKCNGSCLCKGAGDCVNMVFSGCCSGAITCDDSGCSCVNGIGCDSDGNPPD